MGELLQMWRDELHGGVASRNDLIDDLAQNQLANSCNPLLLALRNMDPKTDAERKNEVASSIESSDSFNEGNFDNDTSCVRPRDHDRSNTKQRKNVQFNRAKSFNFHRRRTHETSYRRRSNSDMNMTQFFKKLSSQISEL